MNSSSPTLSGLASASVLNAAWEKIRRRGAAPGIDRVTVEAYGQRVEAHLAKLAKSLESGGYKPKPARRVHLKEDPGRRIAVSTVEDRIVQRAMADLLAPSLERTLSDNAYAYRPGRSVEAALKATEAHLEAGRRWVVRTDIQKFFDQIDRDRLLEMLAQRGVEASLCRIVRLLLGAGVVEGAMEYDPGRGTPQGSALSPLLSNLYLQPVDKAMEEARFAYLRYADDILILCATEHEATDGLDLLGEEVEALGLKLNARKTWRSHVGAGFVFLGARFDTAGRTLSQGAYKALAGRAEAIASQGQATDLQELGALVRRWVVWYETLRLNDIDTLPLLAGCLFEAERLGQKDRIAALSGQRLGLDLTTPAPAWLHVSLTETWSRYDTPSAACACVLDAAAACRQAMSRELRQRLSQALSIPKAALDALAGPWKELPRVFGAHGRVTLAKAARRLINDRGGLTTASAEPGWLTEASDDDLLRFAHHFSGCEGIHALECKDQRGHLRFSKVERPLDSRDLRQHLSGGSRRGVYIAREDQSARVGAIEVRVKRAALLDSELNAHTSARSRREVLTARAHDHTAALARAAGQMGLAFFFEDTGGQGRRLWLPFAKPVPLRHLRRLLQNIIDSVGDAPQELHRAIYPLRDHIRAGHGPCLSLPLGLNPQTRQRSVLLDRNGQPISEPLARIASARTGPRVVHQLVRRGSAGPPTTTAEPKDRLTASLKATPRTQRVLEGCAVLNALAHKAHKLGHLEGHERATIFESLGHLHEEAPKAIPMLLSTTPKAKEAYVRRRLSNLHDSPISCPRIRQRHAELSVRVGCDCRFRLKPGAWPTPVLHTLKPEQIPAMKARMKGRAARPAAKPRPRPRPKTPRKTQPKPMPDEFLKGLESTLSTLNHLRRNAEGIERSIAKAESRLDALFKEAGTDRVRLSAGWLVRDPGPPRRFVMEL